tara:strand:- start:326 stop:436 length:111 start_codon:yes stop_codon:yes gene_type:complete
MWEALEIILLIGSPLSILYGLYLLLEDASKEEEKPE